MGIIRGRVLNCYDQWAYAPGGGAARSCCRQADQLKEARKGLCLLCYAAHFEDGLYHPYRAVLEQWPQLFQGHLLQFD